MSEKIVLDKIAASGATRYELDITQWIDVDGPDWGEATVDPYYADMSIGSAPVGYRTPNRDVKIPLNLRDAPEVLVGTITFDEIRSWLQAKVALFHREGGWISRTVDTGTLHADIVDAALHLGGSEVQAFHKVDVDAVLSLSVIPEWYGDEIYIGYRQESLLPELTFTLGTDVAGAYPGRARVIVENTGTASQHALIWGFRSKYYPNQPDPLANLAYEAEELTPIDAATVSNRTWASGGKTVRFPTLPAGTWCPVVSTDVPSVGSLTHVGSYRVWARVFSSTSTPKVRLVWDVGDLLFPNENPPVNFANAGDFYMVDLGEIRIERPPIGAHRWRGVVQAYAEVDNDSIEIDRIFFQPLDDGAGKAVATQSESPLGLHRVKYHATAADNAGIGTAAWTLFGTEAAMTAFGNTISHYFFATNFGLNIPVTATINGIKLEIERSFTPPLNNGIRDYAIRLLKAGAVYGSNPVAGWTMWDRDRTFYTYGSETDLWGGTWTPAEVNATNFGAAISAQVVGNNATATTGFLYRVRITVYYTSGGGFALLEDAVVFPGEFCELRTDGVYRSKDGINYSRCSIRNGKLPRMPVSGLEERQVEMFLKMSRGNLYNESDPRIDNTAAYIYYRPCYPFTP